MRAVPASYLTALRGSHVVVARVRLVTPGQTGTDPTGVELTVIDGSVTLSSTAQIRSTVTLTLAEPWPADDSTSSIAPYGSELYVEKGLVLGDGSHVWVGLGYFRIDSVDQQDTPDSPLEVSGSDRMANVVDGQLLAPVQYDATDEYGAIFADLVGEVLPDVSITWDDSSNVAAIGRSIISANDRFTFLNSLVVGLGKQWYFDASGVLTIKDVPDLAASVWQVDAGQDGVLTSASRSISRDGVFNIVTATGQAADDTVPASYGEAEDSDPSSPTYALGPFGRVPYAYSSPLLLDDDAAAKAAQTILGKVLGRPYSVSFGSIPNAALEPYDCVTVVFPPVLGSTPTTLIELHVIDQLQIPLTPGEAMSATTRVVFSGGEGLES